MVFEVFLQERKFIILLDVNKPVAEKRNGVLNGRRISLI